MDNMGAFPSVEIGRLVNLLMVRQLDEDLIRWTGSFPWERKVEMTIEGNAMERDSAEAGVPQGSPVSPILLAIHTSGLLECILEYVSA